MGRSESQLPLMVGSCLRRPLARFLNGQALSVPLMVGIAGQ